MSGDGECHLPVCSLWQRQGQGQLQEHPAPVQLPELGPLLLLQSHPQQWLSPLPQQWMQCLGCPHSRVMGHCLDAGCGICLHLVHQWRAIGWNGRVCWVGGMVMSGSTAVSDLGLSVEPKQALGSHLAHVKKAAWDNGDGQQVKQCSKHCTGSHFERGPCSHLCHAP